MHLKTSWCKSRRIKAINEELEQTFAEMSGILVFQTVNKNNQRHWVKLLQKIIEKLTRFCSARFFKRFLPVFCSSASKNTLISSSFKKNFILFSKLYITSTKFKNIMKDKGCLETWLSNLCTLSYLFMYHFVRLHSTKPLEYNTVIITLCC